MARTEQQNEQIRETRKEKIRVEALKQFSAKGLFATRIQDIAEGAGMAQGLLYHYYPSKDAIYIDLINDALDKTNAASVYVSKMHASAKEKILYSLNELLKTIETSERFSQTCRLISQAINSTAIPLEAQRLIEEKRNIPYQIISDVMKQGQKEGSVVDADPYELAILFWTSVNGLSIYKATRKQAGAMPDYRLLAAMFLKD